MPITYEYEAGPMRLRTRCIGDVKLEEVLEHFALLETDARVPGGVDVLLDLTRLENLPESEQFRAVARELGQLETRFRWRGLAVAASSDALYGMVRVFLAHAQDHVEEAVVFRDTASAERWLDERWAPRD